MSIFYFIRTNVFKFLVSKTSDCWPYVRIYVPSVSCVFVVCVFSVLGLVSGGIF